MTLYVISFVIIASSLLSAGKSETSDFLILGAQIYFALGELKHRKRTIPSMLEMLFIMSVAIISLLSLIFSDSILTGHQSIRSWLIVTFFAVTCGRLLRQRSSIEVLVKTLIYFSAIIAVVSLIVNILNLTHPVYDINIIFPSYGHIRFAEFFLPLFPISVFLFLDKNQSLSLKISSLVAVLFLFITFSRATWVSMIIVPIILPYFLGGLDKRYNKIFLTLSLALIVFMAVMFNVWSKTEYVTRNNFQFTNIVLKPLYLDTRTKYYTFSLSKIVNKPILGHGPGTFYFSNPNFLTDPSTTISAHNHILQKLYETGIIGAFVYFFFLGYLYIRAIKTTRGNRFGRAVLMGVFVSFIQAQMDFGWEIPIVYLFNIIFITYYQPTVKATSRLSEVMSKLVLYLIILWTIFLFFSPVSTSQKYSHLVSRSTNESYVTSSLVRQWMTLDKGNGRIYSYLSGKEYMAGNYQNSLDYILKSVKSPMYSVTTQIYLVRYLMVPGASNLDELSIFRLLKTISDASYPHDFFWVKPDYARTRLLSSVDGMLGSNTLLNKLNPEEIAQIYYWKYIQTFISGEYRLSEYIKFIDLAAELDLRNKEYENISRISHEILETKDAGYLLKELSELLIQYPKRDIYISLGDLVYSNYSEFFKKTGNLNKELEIRQSRIDFSHYGSAYISLVTRLKELDRLQDADKLLLECIRLYPKCSDWYQNTPL